MENKLDHLYEQLDLINELRRLWIEHVMWTRSFIISTVEGLKDLQYVTNRLLQNPGDFAKVFEKYYGETVANNFRKLFTDHLLIASDLVNAAKKGDTANVESLEKKWYANADEIAKFLASINPNWSEETWKNLLDDHLAMTLNEALYRLQGKYEEDIRNYDAIQKEALIMADYMAGGIIRQFEV